MLAAITLVPWAASGPDYRMDTFHYSVDRLFSLAQSTPTLFCYSGAADKESLGRAAREAARCSGAGFDIPIVVTADGATEWVRIRRHLDARWGATRGLGHAAHAWGARPDVPKCALLSPRCGCTQGEQASVAPCSAPVGLPPSSTDELCRSIRTALRASAPRPCPARAPEEGGGGCWGVSLFSASALQEAASFHHGAALADASPLYRSGVVEPAEGMRPRSCGTPAVVVSGLDTTPLFRKELYPRNVR